MKQRTSSYLLSDREARRTYRTGTRLKAYHHLHEVTAMLRNEDRSYKPWEQFRKEADAVNQKYNRNWLRAEYQMAVGSAQMADKWAAYQKEGDQYDLLYLTAGDTAVREEHALLDQTCLPPSDPAWATLYPPNGWGCRCNVIQVLAGSQPHSDSRKAIATMEAITPGKQAIFRFNPALAGRIFPPKHPYYGKKGYEHCIHPKLAQEEDKGQKEVCEVLKEAQAVNRLTDEEKTQRKALYNKAREALKNTVGYNKIEIRFSTRGIKEFINQPHSQYLLKNELVMELPKLLKEGKYIRSIPYHKEQKIGRIRSSHYYRDSNRRGEELAYCPREHGWVMLLLQHYGEVARHTIETKRAAFCNKCHRKQSARFTALWQLLYHEDRKTI